MLRRDSRLFVRSLLHVLIIGCILLAGCAGAVLLIIANDAGESKPLTLALVNEDENSSVSTMVLNLVADNDNISSAVAVEFADTEEEAIQMVKDGAAAALIIPDDFFASVNYGTNYPCRIVLNSGNASAAKTIKYFSDLGSDMLSAAQYCIYEGDIYLQEQGADDSVRSLYNLYLNTSVVSEAAAAPDTYFIDIDIGYTSTGLSQYAHYIAAYLGFFFGLLSICFFHLYKDDLHREKLMRLFSAGISRKRFFSWKIVLPAALFAVLTAVVLFIAKSYVKIYITPVSVISVVAAVLFTAAFCALFAAALGESSGAVTFVVFFVSLFFIGGIIPYSNLSAAALAIGRFTPLGTAYNLFAVIMGGTPDPASYIMAAVYTAAGIYFANNAVNRQILGKETV